MYWRSFQGDWVFCYFLTFTHSAPDSQLSADERDSVVAFVRHVPSLKRAQVLTPAPARDRYIDDGPAPMLTLQLYFERLEAFEREASARGALQAFANALPGELRSARVTQQVMWARQYPTPSIVASARPCCFLVHYPGEAEDLNEWHNYYLDHHPQIMARFPGIGEIEIYTRVDWRDSLPWPRVHHFQRNRIAFDSADALEGALHSPAREQLKRDREQFPRFSGGNRHYAMHAETIIG